MSLLAGESAGLIDDAPPAAEITRRLAAEIDVTASRIGDRFR